MTAITAEKTSDEQREFPLAFPDQEYRDRRRKVRAEMEKRGIDTLFVSSPANLTYLTGYDSRWYRRSTPTGVAVNVAPTSSSSSTTSATTAS